MTMLCLQYCIHHTSDFHVVDKLRNQDNGQVHDYNYHIAIAFVTRSI